MLECTYGSKIELKDEFECTLESSVYLSLHITLCVCVCVCVFSAYVCIHVCMRRSYSCVEQERQEREKKKRE